MALTSSERQIRLPEGLALHARPAGALVRTALRFRSRITVAAGGQVADAKSILKVLALGAAGGCLLDLRADGEDSTQALDALSDCIAGLSD